MASHHLEFGIDLRLPEMDVFHDGRVHVVGTGAAACAPYFEQVAGEHDPAASEARLTHFMTRPFPGHEWNHLALYAIQEAPVEIVRGIAYAALPQGNVTPHVTWERADRDVIEESLRRLEPLLQVYREVLGPKATSRVVDATRSCLASRSYVVARSPAPEPPRWAEQALSESESDIAPLDEIYLHAAFTAESFAAYLDIRVLEAQGLDGAECRLPRSYENPLLARLLAMSSARATRFLADWHRKSYRFPRFAKRFFRTAARVPIQHGPFGGQPSHELE